MPHEFQFPPTTTCCFRVWPLLRGLLFGLALLIAVPGLASDLPTQLPQPDSDATASPNEPVGKTSQSSLLQTASDKLSNSIRRKLDGVVQGRTQAMMEKLRRNNEHKMTAAIRIATRMRIHQHRAVAIAHVAPIANTAEAPSGALAMAEPQRGGER